MIVRDKEFYREYVKIWDDGALRDAPFITLGVEAILGDFYGDLSDAPPPFPVTPGARTLDLGCGWGRVLKPVMDRGADAVGIDISENMLNLAKNHLHNNNLTPLLVRGDGTRLPFRDESFDLVYTLLVLQHLSKKNGALLLNEIARILKPGGAAYIRVPARFAPENLLFCFLQFVSIHFFRLRDPIRMRFYRIGEIRKICNSVYKNCTITAHEFRPPWNFHTRWTWHYIIVPRRFHKRLRKLSDRIERLANGRLGFLKHFGVVLMVKVGKE
jgi:ubiquinone/menaquinone biosynthesis C-methylase UbiE